MPLQKSYFLMVIGGGKTGDIQVDDKSYHKQAKAAYQNNEMKLTQEMLKMISSRYQLLLVTK